uniref:Uncharacterized protein n=1 Tax=Anguilla anguilla TaxID=7936 RepID=A0A0E9T5W4_ANGAN
MQSQDWLPPCCKGEWVYECFVGIGCLHVVGEAN